MMQLLRFHVIYSKKVILTTLPIVIAAFILPSLQINDFNLSFFMFMFSIYLPTIVSSHLLDSKFSSLIYTFPISTKQYVQSTYIYITLIFCFLGVPTMFWIVLQLYIGNANAFDLYFSLSIFSYCMVATGSTIKAHFKHPTKDNPFSGSDAFFYLLFIGISQTFIGFFFSGIFDLHLGALIIPAFCTWLFYRQYKSSIAFYEKIEFL